MSSSKYAPDTTGKYRTQLNLQSLIQVFGKLNSCNFFTAMVKCTLSIELQTDYLHINKEAYTKHKTVRGGMFKHGQ
jgi:hypothetical protein